MSEAPRRTPPRLIEVVASETITPSLIRVTFGGATLEGFGPGWPAAHLKLFFPRPHQTVPRLPTLNAEGGPVWPEAGESPVVRTYSTRRHDVARGTLEVDFVVHEPSGPASHWASQARPGMRIGLAGPGGPQPMFGSADWVLIAGDLSALPAIAALCESMPSDTRGRLFVQTDDERDRPPLTLPPALQVTWLTRRGSSDDDALQRAVAAAQLPDGVPQVWLAGENSAVVALRDALVARYPAARPGMYAVPYWKRRQSEEQYHQERHRVMDELAGA